jgi:hypothetical protein
MMYFFERRGVLMRSEIRLDGDGHGYELVIQSPDSVRVERFTESSARNERWAEIERQLTSEGWCEPERQRV